MSKFTKAQLMEVIIQLGDKYQALKKEHCRLQGKQEVADLLIEGFLAIVDAQDAEKVLRDAIQRHQSIASAPAAPPASSS